MTRLADADSQQRKFYQDVINTIQSVPHGRVVSYGQVARLAGRPRHARQIGRILGSSPVELPWHRVLKSDGSLAARDRELQRQRLALENVEVRDYRVNMKRYQVPIGEI